MEGSQDTESAMVAQRRARRRRSRVFGRPQDAEFIAARGLRRPLLAEITRLLDGSILPPRHAPRVTRSGRGVLLRCASYDVILELMLRCRLAQGVNLVLYEGRARSYGDLRKSLPRWSLERFLDPGRRVALRVESFRSRAFHEGRITSLLANALEEAGYGVDPAGPGPRLEVDLVDNRVRVGVDLAGERLYKRGYRPAVGVRAPLREDLAAALAAMLWTEPPAPPSPVDLVVPFAGAGTLGLEALAWSLGVPLTFGRATFGAALLDCHRAGRWRHLVERLAEATRSGALAPGPKIATVTFIDLHETALAAARTSWAALRKVLAGVDLPPARFVAADATTALAEVITERPFALLANPPYGRRLGSPQAARRTTRRFLAAVAESGRRSGRLPAGLVLLGPSAAAAHEARRYLARQIDMNAAVHIIDQGGLDCGALIARPS